MRGLSPWILMAGALGAWLVGSVPGYGEEDTEPAVAIAETVRAQRYQLTTYASALDYSHRMGVEIVELYFPESGIVCNLATGFGSDCVANAFYGASRADPLTEEARKLLGAKAPPRVVPEEVEVPRAVFERVRALADVTRRRIEMAAELKAALGESTLFTLPE